MPIYAILFLAVLIEGTLTYLFKASEGSIDASPKPWLKYVALVFGVVLAVLYKVDIPAMVGLMSPVAYVGYVVSGVIIGRGSNVVNDTFGAISKWKTS
jgi:hypothetical protein